jgi:hypothetical protein
MLPGGSFLEGKRPEREANQSPAFRAEVSSGVPRGIWGVQHPPPRNSEVLQNRTGLQIERKMFNVAIPTS